VTQPVRQSPSWSPNGLTLEFGHAVKVSLLYKKSARESISTEDLTAQIERGGHQVLQAVQRGTDISVLLDPPVELVVAAGGDGTVAAAAKAVAGNNIPLAILPLGTANNIAKSLNVCGPLPELIEGWRQAVRLPFDLGVASGNDEDFLFVEGVGGGLIPAGISAARLAAESDYADAAAKVTADLRRYHEIMLHMAPCRVSLAADGADISGDYLVVEVLNIPSVGPNIVFSPDVAPSDGFLSVVTAGEEHRGALLSYLEDRISGRARQLSLPTRLARTVEIDGGGILHLDDQTHRAAELGLLSLRTRPAALHILTPAP
jgi:diacylglycerol kinase (ATP)